MEKTFKRVQIQKISELIDEKAYDIIIKMGIGIDVWVDFIAYKKLPQQAVEILRPRLMSIINNTKKGNNLLWIYEKAEEYKPSRKLIMKKYPALISNIQAVFRI